MMHRQTMPFLKLFGSTHSCFRLLAGFFGRSAMHWSGIHPPEEVILMRPAHLGFSCTPYFCLTGKRAHNAGL